MLQCDPSGYGRELWMNMRLHCIVSKVMRSQRGASAIEYGMIVAMIVLVIFVALQAVAGHTVGMWNDIETKTTAATSKN